MFFNGIEQLKTYQQHLEVHSLSLDDEVSKLVSNSTALASELVAESANRQEQYKVKQEEKYLTMKDLLANNANDVLFTFYRLDVQSTQRDVGNYLITFDWSFPVFSINYQRAK